ncbi:uncharacterized [Tachysurus ichikawai]
MSKRERVSDRSKLQPGYSFCTKTLRYDTTVFTRPRSASAFMDSGSVATCSAFCLPATEYRRVPQDITTATAGTRRSLPSNGRERERRSDRGGGGAVTAGSIPLAGATSALFHSDTSQTPTPQHSSTLLL